MGKVFSHCEVCGNPIKEGYETRDGCHKNCYEQVCVCHICNIEIPKNANRAFDKLENAYHIECWDDPANKICDFCECFIPAGEAVNYGGNYHAECWKRLYICPGCGGETSGMDIVPSGQGVYHQDCFTVEMAVQNDVEEISRRGGRLSRVFPKDEKIGWEVIYQLEDDAALKTLEEASTPGYQWELMFPKKD